MLNLECRPRQSDWFGHLQHQRGSQLCLHEAPVFDRCYFFEQLSLSFSFSLSTKYIGAIWRDPPLNEGFGQIGFLGGKGLPYLGRNHVALFHHNVLALPGQTVGADDIRTENKTDKLSSQAAFLAVDGGDARISQRASQYQMRTSQNQMRSAKKTDNIEYTGSFTSDTGMLGTLGTLDKVWGPLTYSWGTCATPVFFGPVSV
jgi:hypothetical protein